MKSQMKLLLLALLIVASFMFGSFAHCAPDKKSAADAKSSLKERLKSGVKKLDNSDVIIELPKLDFSKVKVNESVGPLLTLFISYVDPDMDFEHLNKNIAREVGGKRNKNGVPIVKIMQGISKGLARNNMQLQKTAFNPNNVINKLDEGVPLIAWLSSVSDVYDKKFVPRTEKRAQAKDMNAWKKELRELEVKKVDKGKTFSRALIMGYNKISGEFMVFGMTEKPIWMTEKEIKMLLLEAYQLRY